LFEWGVKVRASAYYFDYEPYCWICNKKVADIDNIEVSASVSDITEPRVCIPVHNTCHRGKISMTIICGAVAFILYAAGIVLIESLIFGYFHSGPFEFARMSSPPAWLTAITILFSAIAGIITFANAYFRYMEFINREIRLHTMPAD
jgi:hypothetical protein